MREECKLHKSNYMTLWHCINYQPPTKGVAEIREIDDSEEPQSSALVPLVKNKSSTAPLDVRTLESSRARKKFAVNYPGGIHCPTQPFWTKSMEIPHIRPLVLPTVLITASKRPNEVCTWRITSHFHPKSLEIGASLPLARLEEGKHTPSTSLHESLIVPCQYAD